MNSKHIERCSRIAERMTKWLTDGGMEVIFFIGILAIALAVIGFYMGHKFVWTELLWEVPLYGFCGWALASAWKMYINIRK